MKTHCLRLGVQFLLVASLSFAGAAAGPVRFFAIGDIPYTDGERLAMEALLAQELTRHPPFLVHVGDIKRGSAPCTDAALRRIADLFRGLPVPVVYTPGDNEWTDCDRPAAGGFEPVERLATLRRLFYADPAVLRLQALGARHEDGGFPENYTFLHRGVLFATVHLVGLHNNLRAKNKSAMAEHAARSAANRRHLARAVAAANAAQASALVLMFQANPGLEKTPTPRGFGPFRQDLEQLLRDYPGPVLVIHGDTHSFKFDHPLRNPRTGEPEPRLTRLEVPGSPMVAGVWVSVDPAGAEPFAVELAYPNSRALMTNE